MLMATARDIARPLRADLDGLSWPDRFERLAVLEKGAAADVRTAIAELRAELAAAALLELRAEWGAMPLKEGILRLGSKHMRGALTRAAKEARDRAIEEIVRTGSPPLGDAGEGAPAFGLGLDERVVEIPLALATARLDTAGKVLDAGAAMNLAVVRRIAGRPAARVTHVTLPGSVEPRHQGDEDRYRRVDADLRALPYADGAFDRAVCVSTLEHVGLDTSRFGAAADAVPDPASAERALAEIVRVLRPGGELMLSVPYGRASDHGWFRTFDRAALDELLRPLSGERVERRFFYYDAGWREGGADPPPSALEASYADDVVTGVAVVRLAGKGEC